jgi:hypothetical protein
MTLKKNELSLLNQLKKKIAKAEHASSEPVMKKYTFKITAAHVVRKETITATSRSEAEQHMFEKYGDLPYELMDVS